MSTITNKFNLEGKVAIVTGSSKGIGAAIARGLAEQGANVVLSSRKQDAVDELAASFKEDGLSATAIVCHVGDKEQRDALIQKTIEQLGGIDILVNNAAINPFFGPLEVTEESIFDKIMEVNVKAPWTLSNLALPSMQARNGGSIINIASVEGLHPGFGLGIYGVSKSALIMLTKNQAKEWGKYGVRSNVICPGLIKTKFSQAIWQNEKTLSHLEKNLPSGRMGVPEEIAGLAVLLASEAGSYSTGATFTADGGYLIAG